MKIIYLLPPSEGKNPWGENTWESLSFDFKKPLEIAKNATAKDLKCKDARYLEGIEMNTHVEISDVLPAISRYSGVMYNAIDYLWMSESWKKYFSDNFLILSGMYGILRPEDRIGNYKLPIETKWLYNFWWDSITQELNNLRADVIVDFLPNSYKKMVDWKKLDAKILRVEFMHTKHGEIKKMTHGVKKVKWEYINTLCENLAVEIPNFWNKKETILEIIN